MNNKIFNLISIGCISAFISVNADTINSYTGSVQSLVCQYTDNQGTVYNNTKIMDTGHWAQYYSHNPFIPFIAIFISDRSYQSIVDECVQHIPTGDVLTDITTIPEIALNKYHIDSNPIFGKKINSVLFSHDVYFTKTVNHNNYPFDRVVFFGDSLSDSSNDFRYYVYLISRAFPGVYWNSRFSNGSMWGDWLTSSNISKNGTGLNLPKINFAWGGAYSFTNRDEILFSLVSQVNEYLDFINSNNLGSDENKTLYSILIGGNDFLSTKHTPVQVANKVRTEIIRLVESAKNNNLDSIYFLIPTVPDVSIVPNESNNPDQEIIHNNIIEYNNLVTSYLYQIKNYYKYISSKKINITIFRPDFASNLTNLIDMAQNSVNNLDSTHACMSSNQGNISVCSNPEGTIFWDGLHPNATAGCMLGQRAADMIESQLGLPNTYKNTTFGSEFLNQCRYTFIQSSVK